MILKFGHKKIAIETGITKDNKYMVIFTKVFHPVDDVASDEWKKDVCDVPVIMQFDNEESLDTVIRALEIIKRLMKVGKNGQIQ